jgi:hypothetical protein
MTTTTHYREAEDALNRAQRGSRASQQDLTKAQLHAMLAVADELRDIHNELIQMRSIIAGLPDTRTGRNS